MDDEKKTAPEKTGGAGKRKIEHWQIITIYMIIYDALAVNLAYFIGLWLRFDCHYTEIPGEYFNAWLRFAPIYAAASVVVLWVMRLYRSMWRFASFDELKRILISSVLLGIFHAAVITFVFHRMPISYYILGIVIQTVLVTLIRFAYRFILLERGKKNRQPKAAASRVMLIGAGNAGQMVLRGRIQL